MNFGCIGLNYKNADLDIRGSVSFTDNKKIDFLNSAYNAGIEQCMILSTCNRSEVYFFYKDARDIKSIWQIYLQTFNVPHISEYMFSIQENDAAGYLFMVAAGLESQVLGEDQILGQVKDALDFTRTMGFCGKELDKVVRDAISCAKQIKTKLKISEIPLSVSYVGISEINRLGGIDKKTVLVIGSGSTSALALRYLYMYDVKVYIVNRTMSHIEPLMKEFPNIFPVDYEKRYEVLQECDIVVSATSSPHLMLKNEKAKLKKDVIMLDLASPRDIDVEFRKDEKCTLIDLDNLKQIVEENKQQREDLVGEGKEIVKSFLDETIKWFTTSRMDDTIKSLQIRSDEIVNDSLAYLDKRLKLGEKDKEIVKKTLNAALQRLLKDPIRGLKNVDSDEQEQYKKVMRDLFNL